MRPLNPTPSSGYIGGSILGRLLAHPNKRNCEITALVGSPEKAERLRTFGINVVTGSTDETEELEKLASNAHVVFSIVRDLSISSCLIFRCVDMGRVTATMFLQSKLSYVV